MSTHRQIRDAETQKATIQDCLRHLQLRIRENRICDQDLIELQQWLETDPDVPEGKWYKRFKSGAALTGNGERASTFLERGMSVVGKEVK
jgi:hypothetical protein